MPAEANKHVMRRFVEFINSASETLATELIAPNAVFHVPGNPEPMRGPAGYLAVRESIPLRPSTGSTAMRMRPPGRRVSIGPPPRRRPVG